MKMFNLIPFCIQPKNNISVQARGAQITNTSRSVKFYHLKNLSYVLYLVLQDTKNRPSYYCPLYIDLTLAKHHNLMISKTKAYLP